MVDDLAPLGTSNRQRPGRCRASTTSHGRHRRTLSHRALRLTLAANTMTSPSTQHLELARSLLDPKPTPPTSSTTLRTRSSHSRIHVLHLPPCPQADRPEGHAGRAFRAAEHRTPHQKRRRNLPSRVRGHKNRAPATRGTSEQRRTRPKPTFTLLTTATEVGQSRHRARHAVARRRCSAAPAPTGSPHTAPATRSMLCWQLIRQHQACCASLPCARLATPLHPLHREKKP